MCETLLRGGRRTTFPSLLRLKLLVANIGSSTQLFCSFGDRFADASSKSPDPLGYTPEIDGEKLELEVLAQHGNNLILRDTTGKPIQHIYGRRERDGKNGPRMKPYPTFRMSFTGFQKAYPDGEVFLNKPSSNPFLRLLDMVTEIAFSGGIAQQHRAEAPVMNNMTHFDGRLPNKTYVWGINIGEDAVCYTQDFLVEYNNLANATIGGRAIVVAYIRFIRALVLGTMTTAHRLPGSISLATRTKGNWVESRRSGQVSSGMSGRSRHQPRRRGLGRAA